MTEYWIRTYIFVAVFSLLASLALTPAIRKLAQIFNLYDKPDARKIHTRSVPLGGGLAIFIPFVVSIFLTRYYSNPLKVIIYGSLVALIVGLIDDFKKGLSGTIKFLILVGLTIFLAKYGVILKLAPSTHIIGYSINLILTILWVVGVTSAFNAIDNMDGLAPGVAFIASCFFAIVAMQTQQWWFGMLSIALAGSCLGFLRYNYKPATIFLGDAGSFFIGFVLAATSIMGDWSTNPLISVTIPVFILGIPIFDIIYVVLWRHYNHITSTFFEALRHCAKDHISHRLVALGFAQHHAVLIIYLLAVCTGICAIVLRNSTSILDSILLLVLGIAVMIILIGIMTVGTKHLKDKYLISSDLKLMKEKLGILPSEKLNVLVVDDDDDVRNLICEFLTSKGFGVITAADANEAFKTIKSTDFQLALVDIVLPGKHDGIDVLRKIKTKDHNIPVIIVTAHSSSTNEIRELRYDAFGEIKKPFLLEDIEDIISKALRDSVHDYIEVIFQNKRANKNESR